MYKIKTMRSKIIKLALSENAYFMCNIRVVYCTWHGGEWDSSKSKSSSGSTGNLRCPDQVSRTNTHIYWDQVLLFDSCSHKLHYHPSSALQKSYIRKTNWEQKWEVKRMIQDVDGSVIFNCSWTKAPEVLASSRSSSLGPLPPAGSWTVSNCPKIYCMGKGEWH